MTRVYNDHRWVSPSPDLDLDLLGLGLCRTCPPLRVNRGRVAGVTGGLYESNHKLSSILKLTLYSIRGLNRCVEQNTSNS